jgi:hypothetical protein
MKTEETPPTLLILAMEQYKINPILRFLLLIATAIAITVQHDKPPSPPLPYKIPEPPSLILPLLPLPCRSLNALVNYAPSSPMLPMNN